MYRVVAVAAFLLTAPAVAEEANTPAPAKIVIYRGASVMGAAVACPVRYQGKEIVELGRGKFVEWPVAPGRYILTNKTASVEVSVAPGETRYVRCQMKMGFATFRSDLQIVDQADFAEVEKDLEPKGLTAQ